MVNTPVVDGVYNVEHVITMNDMCGSLRGSLKAASDTAQVNRVDMISRLRRLVVKHDVRVELWCCSLVSY